MTAQYVDQPLDFDSVSEPITGETRAVVESTATDIFGSWEWDEFVFAVRQVGRDYSGEVDPAHVRAWLSDANDVLTINPRKLSAFYNRARSSEGHRVFALGDEHGHEGPQRWTSSEDLSVAGCRMNGDGKRRGDNFEAFLLVVGFGGGFLMFAAYIIVEAMK